MKNTYYLTSLRECDSQDQDRWDYVAQNTGNLVFYKAIQKIFNIGTLSPKEALEQDIEIENLITADLIWIEEEQEYDFLVDFYHKIKNKMRFIPLSIGLHTGKKGTDFRFAKATLNFLSELSEQVMLPCRGEYTAGMLSKQGIKNVTILGCPSLYYHKDENFKLIKSSQLPADPKVSTNCTLYPNKYSPKEVLKNFIAFSEKYNGVYIEQTNFEWIDKLANNEIEKQHFRLFQKNMKYFFDFSQWLEYMKQFDFVLGNRFHGNVMGILAGVPAFIFAHDNRLQEMCDYFKLPYAQMTEFDSKKTLQYWYDRADFAEFNNGYRERYLKFIDYFKNYGVEIKT